MQNTMEVTFSFTIHRSEHVSMIIRSFTKESSSTGSWLVLA